VPVTVHLRVRRFFCDEETCHRAIFAASAREQALRIASSVAQKKWREKGYEKVAEHIEEHVEECLTCLSFPESHRRRIRTTNGLERLNQEVKRRTPGW
jgi:transposase-like protein